MVFEINVTGYSGRFPNASNVHEFWKKLKHGIDLVGPSRRYPDGYLGLPRRAGHLTDIDRFDMSFFKMNKKQVDGMDPQTRMLLESTIEALQDANVDIHELAGSNTGVYIGCCFSDYHSWILNKPGDLSGYENVGSAISMGPNKISYFLDLKGPSLAVDTACSSSLTALDMAVRDIKSGRIDKAIVGGVSLTLRPQVSSSFAKYKMLSPTGTCRSFSGDADGYCRSEAVGVVFLEKTSDKGYITILGTGVNSDGYTEKGITFPNKEAQASLMQQVLRECNVLPRDIEYIEAHGTGTVAGDGVEIMALDEVYGSNERCILLGSLKSNMGHSEGASGIMSMIKLMMCYEHGILTPNLHYSHPVHEPIISGRFHVVTDARTWDRGHAAISNFGFGGTSVHVVMKKGPYVFSDPVMTSSTMRSYGRESVIPNSIPSSYKNVGMYDSRGIVENGNVISSRHVQKADPPVCWLFSGQGSNWLDMGKDLMEYEPFVQLMSSLNKWIDEDLCALFADGSRWYEKGLSTIGICAIQIFLVDHLNSIKQPFDFVLGHSMGEMAASYADGVLTAKQTIMMAELRSKMASLIPPGYLVRIEQEEKELHTAVFEELETVASTPTSTVFKVERDDDACLSRYSHLEMIDMLGTMAVVGESVEFLEHLLVPYPNTVIACYNSPMGQTVSGPSLEVDALLNDVKRIKPEAFVRRLETGGVAFHSRCLVPFKDFLVHSLSDLIPGGGTPFSTRWLSTSGGVESVCDAMYHTNNIMSPVFLHSAIQKLPPDTLVLEIGPSSSLLSQVKRSREDVVPVAVLERNKPERALLRGLGDRLWIHGVSNMCEPDYPLTFSHRHRCPWDHRQEHTVPTYDAFESRAETSVRYDLLTEHAFLRDHVIDGREIFPATGHIYTIWRHVGQHRAIRLVEFHIHVVVLMSDKDNLCFTVQQSGELVGVYLDGERVASGLVRTIVKHDMLPVDDDLEAVTIDTCDLYNSLSRHGYEYKKGFRLVREKSPNGVFSLDTSGAHHIAYLDNILQCSLGEISGLRLPTSIKEITIMPGEMGDRVVFDSVLGTVRSSSAVFCGMHTTPAPIHNTKNRIVNRAQVFVEYGRTPETNHVVDSYLRLTVHTVLPAIIEFVKNNKNAYPWLQKSIDVLSSVAPPSAEALTNREDFVILHIVRDLCSTPEKLQTFMTKPFLSISTHKEHAQLYKKDITCRNDYWMDIMCGIICDELSSQRILEIGTGTGALLDEVVSRNDLFIDRYHASDISSINMDDISCDERFSSFHYDVNDKLANNTMYNLVVAGNSIHTCRDIRTSIQNVLDVMEPGGLLLLVEHVSSLPCALWGLDSFVWDTPTDERAYGLWMSIAEWEKIFHDTGLVVVKMLSNSVTMCVLLKKPITEHASSTVCHTWSDVDTGGKTHFVGDGSFGFVRSLLKEGYDVHAHEGAGPSVHDEYGMRFNAYQGGVHGTFVSVPIAVPMCQTSFNHRLGIQKPGDLTTMGWVQAPEQIVRVAIASLNFRDVMVAFGKLKLDTISFGLEYAGYDGCERVMGFGTGGCLAQHVKRELCWSVPDHMSMEEAATIPVVYSTAYYALFEKAKLCRGQSVLIHCGAGGVGNAALYLCKKRGINIFTTCSEEKREWLKSEFGLHDAQVGDSRSSSFRDMVLTQTTGEGVDCVLNCLSGELLFNSLDLVRPYGHFCEIGKYDLMNDTKVGLRPFSENVSYHAIDLSTMVNNPKMSKVLYDLVQNGLDKGEIVPLNFRTFGKESVEEALRFMSNGRHRGKVLIDMSQTRVPIQVTPRFFTSGTHIVVGGLGGFGMELAHWLFGCGADRIVLTSRSKPKTGHQVSRLRSLETKGRVVLSQLNVVDYLQCEELIVTHQDTLKGVWHTAMVLQDSIYENMTKTKWDTCVNTKKQAFQNLSECTKMVELDIFCGFSSISSLFGNAGQSNYAFANSAMESIVHNRRNNPEYRAKRDLVVQWGCIGNVGFMSRDNTSTTLNRFFGTPSVDICLDNLHDLIFDKNPVISSYEKALLCTKTKETCFRDWFCNMMGLVKDDCVNMKKTLFDIGLDSLQAVETRNKLATYGIEKTITNIGHVTLNEIWDI